MLNNQKKIYLFSFFWMFLVIMPVIVPFFLNLGLNMQEVFQLTAIFGVAVVVLEIPTGYLCDLWGRKKTLIFGSFISGLGYTYLFYAKTFWQLVGYEIIIALALSFVSGADISLLYDSIEKSKQREGTKVIANMQLASVSGESVAAVLGGLLVTFSFKHVLVAHALAGWVPFFIALTLHETPYEKMIHKNHWHNFRDVFNHLFFNRDKLLILIFTNLSVWGLSTFFAVWIFQKSWQENGIALASFGLIWAAYNFSVGLVGKQVHWIEQRWGPNPLLLVMAAAPIVGYLSLAFFGGIAAVGLGLLFQLSRGICQVLLCDALNWRTPAAFRATANSLQSFFFRLGFAIFGPAIGYLIDRFGTPFALKSLAGVFTVLLFLTLIPLLRAIRETTPDYIPEK